MTDDALIARLDRIERRLNELEPKSKPEPIQLADPITPSLTSPVLYMSAEAAHLIDGMYLALLHGRDSVAEVMEFWGFDGPMIGPLIGYHTTYSDHIRIGFQTSEEAKRFFPDTDDRWVDLTFEKNLLKYDGKFYGDWTVYPHTQAPA